MYNETGPHENSGLCIKSY